MRQTLSKMSERIIIGDMAGKLVSAPVSRADEMASTIRWRHNGASFVLEQWVQRFSPSGGVWIEVPCVMPEQGKDK